MITTTLENGRLGNQIIRNLAVSLIAEKNNLKVEYSNRNLISKLGIELFSGDNFYLNIINLTDNNYFNIFHHSQILNFNLEPNNNFFQTKDITNLIYLYLHKNEIKSNIISKNEFKERYNTNNDLFIHIRLDDASRFNPGLNYYLKTIKNIENFDNLYISSDEVTHPIISEIIREYPNTKVFIDDEIKTIQFASTCKNIILSHGSFSAIIGYLSFYSNVYYPEYEKNKIWYGDMFSIDGWIKCNV
jgi:hypothetical protein